MSDLVIKAAPECLYMRAGDPKPRSRHDAYRSMPPMQRYLT
jgi:hypothetical protein